MDYHHTAQWCANLIGTKGFLQELGADEVIDYTSQRFEDVLKSNPVDVVIDPIGGTVIHLLNVSPIPHLVHANATVWVYCYSPRAVSLCTGDSSVCRWGQWLGQAQWRR